MRIIWLSYVHRPSVIHLDVKERERTIAYNDWGTQHIFLKCNNKKI